LYKWGPRQPLRSALVGIKKKGRNQRGMWLGTGEKVISWEWKMGGQAWSGQGGIKGTSDTPPPTNQKKLGHCRRNVKRGDLGKSIGETESLSLPELN